MTPTKEERVQFDTRWIPANPNRVLPIGADRSQAVVVYRDGAYTTLEAWCAGLVSPGGAW